MESKTFGHIFDRIKTETGQSNLAYEDGKKPTKEIKERMLDVIDEIYATNRTLNDPQYTTLPIVSGNQVFNITTLGQVSSVVLVSPEGNITELNYIFVSDYNKYNLENNPDTLFNNADHYTIDGTNLKLAFKINESGHSIKIRHYSDRGTFTSDPSSSTGKTSSCKLPIGFEQLVIYKVIALFFGGNTENDNAFFWDKQFKELEKKLMNGHGAKKRSSIIVKQNMKKPK